MIGMEAALASGLLKVAGDKLVSLITSEFAAIMRVKNDLSELQDIHEEITSWLSLVRDRAIESDPSLRWVMKLRDLAYNIDDLLDEVQFEKQKIERDDEKHAVFCCVYEKPKPKKFLFQAKVAHMIKEIKMTYAAILNQRSNTNTIMSNLPVDHSVSSRRINRKIGEFSMLGNVEESKLPTRDQEKVRIMAKLLESNEGEDGLTISVVGLGGSGKTTLAKHICHDSKIKEHFRYKVFWVHVSQEFDVEKLINKLFEAIVEQKSDLHAQQHMLREISNKLSGKKFLLVLDDAWHEDRNDWEQFMVHLKSGAPGSKILLTTRDRKVAESVKSRYIFDLAFLSEAESWNLFLESSGCVEKELDYEFIQVGKETVNKCGGVPLAIKTLGGILCEKKELSTWRAISESDLWNVKSIKDRVFVSLKLSYIHLADELKQCFTFCSIFPKGHEIYKDHLIAQWIAHGFINPMNEEQSEDIGNDYFDSLVKVGFLHNPCECWNSKRLICKMHDLIHDLTRQILLDEVMTCLPNKKVTENCIHRGRYLSLISCTENVDRDLFDKVHALYVDGDPSFIKLVKKVYYVRSVTLQYRIDGWGVPRFILKFEYIRYLEIRNSSCKGLSDDISGCWNLQTLLFIDCNRLESLPNSIGKLKKLRTLEISKGTDFVDLPHSIGDCQDLQYLQLYSCDELVVIPKSICNIQNLRVLHIVRCPFVKLPSEFIGRLSSLQTINLSNSCIFHDLPSTFACCTLHTLNLSKTSVTILPQWLTSIGSLECIDLEDCTKLVELPNSIENLKRLKVLYIKGCCKLRCLPSGFGKLIQLRRLGLFVVGHAGDGASILELKNLDMISGDMEITNLKDLKDQGDAEKACLKRKKNIQNLTLTWLSGLIEEELVLDIEHDQGVLDALEPPSEIKTLSIGGYRGPYLPHWMRKQSNSYSSERVMLTQTNSPQFYCLTELKLEGLPNLKHMRGLLLFPSLKSIYIYKMPNLEELWMTTTGLEREEEVGMQYCFPVLSHLFIKDCPRLIVKPYFTPSLEWLKLEKCNDQLLSSVPIPPYVSEPLSSCITLAADSHLKELQLDRLTGSSSDWEFLQLFTGLESLEFENCIEHRQLPESMRRLSSLQKLSIYKCSSLVALPEWFGELRCLQTVVVADCPMIDSLPQSMENLTSLVKLHICRLDNLKQLPEAIRHLSSLQKLQLEECRALNVLPEGIGQLSALRWLSIQYCSALQSLPHSIEHLTDLKNLFIAGCPGLAGRYDKESGTEWHLISHIPEVWIKN